VSGQPFDVGAYKITNPFDNFIVGPSGWAWREF
jgi:hypothetical protein